MIIDINFTFIAELVAFIIFVIFTRTKVVPVLIMNLEKRKNFINSQLEKSKTADIILEQSKLESERIYKSAQIEYNRILLLAKEGSNDIRQQAISNLEKELEDIRICAQEDAKHVILQAQNTIQADIKKKSLLIAEEILKRSITKEDNDAIIETLIRKL